MKRIEESSFTHPWRSSDFVIHGESQREGRTFAISGVLDTIGRPRRGRMKKVRGALESSLETVVRDSAVGDMDSLDARFCEELAGINALTRQVGEKQKGVFGFCLVFAVRVDRSVRIHWMGDCRAYRFSYGQVENGQMDCEAECLTRDNNKLSSKVIEVEEDEEREGLELLKNEMLSLSRQLELYLGIGHDGHFAEKIAEQTARLELGENEALLLTTDGLYVPIVRYAVANAGFKLTSDLLYLEEWFARYIENGEYLRDYAGGAVWDALGADLKKACIKYTRSKGRYRDDMAALFMY